VHPRSTSPVLLAAGVLSLLAPATAAATPNRPTALTRDLDADGRVDAVDVRRAPVAAVDGAKVERLQRRGAGLRLHLAERAADTALRPVVRIGARRVRAADGAAPVAIALALDHGTPVLRWSEHVRVARRSRAAVIVEGIDGGSRAVRLRSGRVTRLGGTALPRRVSATVLGAVRDAAGNRARRFVLTTSVAPHAPLDPPAPLPATPSPTPAPLYPPTAAKPAAAFRDSIGVNVHMSYFSTAYGNFAGIKDALLKLGVRHIRDGACATCTTSNSRLLDLGAAGIRALLIIGSPKNTTGTLDENLAFVKTKMLGVVDALEGPNEYDYSGDPNWKANLWAYQTRFFTEVNADPALASLPILAPSVAGYSVRSTLGDMSAIVDAGNLHSYPGGQRPSLNLSSELTKEAAISGTKPVWASETGYTNALLTTSGHKPIDETGAGYYIPRMALDYFSRGITRTYVYELNDQKPDDTNTDIQRHFGLMRADLSPKPAYAKLQALIASIGDGTPAGGAGSLSYQLPDAAADVRQLLLQRADGSFALVLWRDVSVWDTTARTTLTVSAANVTLNLGQPIASAKVVRAGSTIRTATNPTTLAVPVGADPVVVQLTL
jgi:hypothetical protein